MRVTHLFSGIPVSDLSAALEWYELFFGGPPDNRPNEREAVWQLADSSLVYVVSDAARAGNALLTLMVEDLGAQVGELERRGIEVGPVEKVGLTGRKVVVTDPDGNSIAIAEVRSLRAELEVDGRAVSPGQTLRYQIHNTGTIELICGVGYRLERASGDEWLHVNAGMAFVAIGFGVQPGERRELAASMPADAGTGRYRISTTVASDHVGGSVEIAAEFNVGGPESA